MLQPRLSTQVLGVRVRQFTLGLEEAGRRSEVLVCRDRSEEAGYRTVLARLRSRRPLDGVFATNDALAFGAFRAARECGRRIPDDIRFLGLGDSTTARFADPPLSCVSPQLGRLNASTANLLLALSLGPPPPRQDVEIDVRLHVRGST